MWTNTTSGMSAFAFHVIKQEKAKNMLQSKSPLWKFQETF